MTPLLIVEDDPLTLRLYTKFLTKAGYETFGATDKAEGRAALHARSYDIFLCDMRLPDGQGIDLIIEERAVINNNGTTVVVVSAEEHYRELCKQAGVDLFMAKPVSPSELVELIRQVEQSRSAL